MALDDIGMFCLSGNSLIIVRAIGRLALPLFIFLSVDGIYHSKNPYKYSLSLNILGFIMDIVLYTISKLFLNQIMIGNVFTLLGLGSLCATLIRRKDLGIIVSGLVFGLIHFNFFFKSMDEFLVEIVNLPSYIFAGLVFAYLYSRTENGIPSIAIHFINNLMATLIILLM